MGWGLFGAHPTGPPPRGIHEPLDGWPLDDLARQFDVVSMSIGHLVYLPHLSRLPGPAG